MVPAEGGEYIHGTDREERRRLTRLNALLNPRALRDLELSAGERVLDVGSGLGLLTLEMALAVGHRGLVLGIERDAAQLAAALHNLGGPSALAAPVELRRGDAARLPLRPGEWGSFDVAHCRFVLEHVPEPLKVVEGMAQAVRRGGRVVLEDDDHDLLRLWPPPDGVEVLWRAYVESYRRRGNDPFVGRRLVELLHLAGLRPVRCALPRFGACQGDESFGTYVENLGAILLGARDAIQEGGEVDDRRFVAALAALEAWGERPDAAFWYVTCWAEGRRPEPGDAA